MTNPFDGQDGTYLVLVNDQRQYSLWPGGSDVPDGWTIVEGPLGRQDCLGYIRRHWVDMRPKSVVDGCG